jgi:hypothetical protein
MEKAAPLSLLIILTVGFLSLVISKGWILEKNGVRPGKARGGLGGG